MASAARRPEGSLRSNRREGAQTGHEPDGRITDADLIAALARVGFRVLRVRGSHHLLRHEDGRSTVVPAHAGETLGPGLLHKILRDCQLMAEQLAELL